ncbi:pectin acetylesterase-family hydrolase [Croceitalea rosinachiae]|uniref:Pectin acetylesterase-family hydrolase n=1 Tax=Croceitalea rosinachiae TaxID=3075596 RepID=A0ABU3A725_9FLAO|nr:pectin acetylesterase-family hydrolase [Croceitalea sp. F388]MDT0605959.1 pectin acetylesterase-family hydrolase [Croceitalea sp. F388]
MIRFRISLLIIFGYFTLLTGCSGETSSEEELFSEETIGEESEENDEDGMSTGLLAFQELYDQGVDKYLGVFTPTSSEVVSGVTEHIFTDIGGGPICFTGERFSMFTRDGSSNHLMIFLQGGGFCSPVACEATETGIPLIPFGILNPNDPLNPTANYDVGYVPYCDGSQMMGDNEVDSDGDGTNDRFFRGVQNLSASLDVIFQTYPNPDKIVLAGNSAGGFAAHNALPLVRRLYPNVNIFMINDSGNGIIAPGGIDVLLDYWNARSFLPESCADCIGADGNLTGYHKYQLDNDQNMRMAYISSKQDSVLSASYPGGAPAFEAELLEATTELNEAYPIRFNGLIANGEAHTYIIRQFDIEVGGVMVRQWVTDMLNENESWTTIIE